MSYVVVLKLCSMAETGLEVVIYMKVSLVSGQWMKWSNELYNKISDRVHTLRTRIIGGSEISVTKIFRKIFRKNSGREFGSLE